MTRLAFGLLELTTMALAFAGCSSDDSAPGGTTGSGGTGGSEGSGLAIQVRREETGPIPNARVAVDTSAGRRVEGTSDESGWVVLKGIPEGAYDLTASDGSSALSFLGVPKESGLEELQATLPGKRELKHLNVSASHMLDPTHDVLVQVGYPATWVSCRTSCDVATGTYHLIAIEVADKPSKKPHGFAREVLQWARKKAHAIDANGAVSIDFLADAATAVHVASGSVGLPPAGSALLAPTSRLLDVRGGRWDAMVITETWFDLTTQRAHWTVESLDPESWGWGGDVNPLRVFVAADPNDPSSAESVALLDSDNPGLDYAATLPDVPLITSPVSSAPQPLATLHLSWDPGLATAPDTLGLARGPHRDSELVWLVSFLTEEREVALPELPEGIDRQTLLGTAPLWGRLSSRQTSDESLSTAIAFQP